MPVAAKTATQTVNRAGASHGAYVGSQVCQNRCQDIEIQILRARLKHEITRMRRQVRRHPRLHPQDGLVCSRLGVCLEGRPAHQQLIRQHADRPHVHSQAAWRPGLPARAFCRVHSGTSLPCVCGQAARCQRPARYQVLVWCGANSPRVCGRSAWRPRLHARVRVRFQAKGSCLHIRSRAGQCFWQHARVRAEI